MKKAKNLLLFILATFFVLLTGCAFFPMSDFGDSSEESMDTIDSFTFITDDKMVLIETSDYYNLVLYAGESYQVKTTVDDILGDTYYLKYTTSKEMDGKFTLSESGYIETNADLDESEVFTIYAELYKHGSSKRVARKYFILSLRVGEYANITLINENLQYDDATSTYSLTMDSGDYYSILHSVSFNVSYVLTYSLTDPNDSAFMSVDNKGIIFTNKTSEDKVGKITIQAIGGNGVLDEVFLQIYLRKSDDVQVEDELKVVNQSNASTVKDGDILDVYKDRALSFDVKFNNQPQTNVITVSDPTILEVDGDMNTVKALKVGTCEVTFAHETKAITVTVNVIQDKVIAIAAENGGGDFVIVNGELHYLNTMRVTYQSGVSQAITDNALISTSVTDKDESYKTVEFTYEEGEIVSVTYDVKYYVTVEYDGQDTAYDNNDYLNNYYIGKEQTLPNAGTVKMLAIPVWFTDSYQFFNQSQQAQIIEDIEYTVNGDRPSSELHSVKQYYKAQSYGAITMDITVSDFYVSTWSYQDFTDNILAKLENTHKLGTSAISWYFENHVNEKLEDYDLNSDGYLDGLLLYYGANYYGATWDINKSIAFEISNNDNKAYSFNTLSFCPIGGLYGLQKQNPKDTQQLTVEDLSQTYGKAFRNSARVAIHEIGHMFGNVDLYEDQFATERYKPAGGFSMQEDDYGTLDPYHVNRIGWSKPQVYASSDYALGDKITLHLTDFQSSGQNIILTNKWNEANSLYDEYLILELFAPAGLNEYDAKVMFMNRIPSGIRVWHVNSVLSELHGDETSTIIDGKQYKLAYDNNDVESKFDVVHMIRNNPEEAYHTTSRLQYDPVLFRQGDAFDMQTFASQFINGSKLDNGEKLGWAFTVDCIYTNADGTCGAVITLERTDNARTEFSQTITLNRSDLTTPSGKEDYSEAIFGENGEFSFMYQYVTPPSYYTQDAPISQQGMCLFASADGNGGYIDLIIKEIDGKEVCITSISVTYSKLTNASLTVLVEENAVKGEEFTPENSDTYGYIFVVNGTSVRIQNQYSEKIDYWSVLPLYELTIHYTVK